MEHPLTSTIMTTKNINFVKDFTKCPGGRLRKYGDKSGEEFRDEILKPALLTHDRVILNMDGALGFPASFLDETFGVLIDQLGEQVVKAKLQIILTDNKVAMSEIEDCMSAHA